MQILHVPTARFIASSILRPFFKSAQMTYVYDSLPPPLSFSYSFATYLPYYLITLRVLPLRITGIMNPAAVWGCDIKNKEDTHKNAAHAVVST